MLTCEQHVHAPPPVHRSSHNHCEPFVSALASSGRKSAAPAHRHRHRMPFTHRARTAQVCEIWVRECPPRTASGHSTRGAHSQRMHARTYARTLPGYVYVYFYAVLLHDTNIFVPLIKIPVLRIRVVISVRCCRCRRCRRCCARAQFAIVSMWHTDPRVYAE